MNESEKAREAFDIQCDLRMIYEGTRKNIDLLIMESSNRIINLKELNEGLCESINQLINSKDIQNPKDKEFIRTIILMHYQTLLNMSEIYLREMSNA